MKSASGMDPFAGLALEMREQARRILPPQWRLGRVTAAGPGMLRIRAGGLDLDEEDLWVDPRLLMGHEEPLHVKFTLAAGAEDEESEEGAPHTLDVGGTYVRTRIQIGNIVVSSIPLYELPGTLSGVFQGTVELLENRLKAGDWVVLLPDETEEFYYVLTKVVQPHDIVPPD